ncbi:MAG: ABC-2 transporter permease [Eubacteriales bacterium]
MLLKYLKMQLRTNNIIPISIGISAMFFLIKLIGFFDSELEFIVVYPIIYCQCFIIYIHFRKQLLLLTLPLERKTIVKGTFFFVLVSSVLITLLFLLYGCFLDYIFHKQQYSIMQWTILFILFLLCQLIIIPIVYTILLKRSTKNIVISALILFVTLVISLVFTTGILERENFYNFFENNFTNFLIFSVVISGFFYFISYHFAKKRFEQIEI